MLQLDFTSAQDLLNLINVDRTLLIQRVPVHGKLAFINEKGKREEFSGEIAIFATALGYRCGYNQQPQVVVAFEKIVEFIANLQFKRDGNAISLRYIANIPPR